MHVSCRNRGIIELDLSAVFADEEEKNALTLVKSLDLSHNELREVQNLQPFSSLTILDLSYNRIVSMTGMPIGLTRLNISHNFITSLEGVTALPFLIDLDISHNKITSLAGLPRMSPLTCLKAGHNRISSLAGIEVLSKLQVAELDFNFVCSLDELRPMSMLSQVRSVTFRGCPVAEQNEYRVFLSSMLSQLVTVDGTSVKVPTTSLERVHNQSDIVPTPPHDTSSGRGEEHSTSAVNVSASAASGGDRHAGMRVQKSLNFDALRYKAESRREELSEQNAKLHREMQELHRMLDAERKENETMHRKQLRAEAEVSEVRRVLADELNKAQRLKSENAQLQEEVRTQKARADKYSRDYKYAHQKLKQEQRRRSDDLEKARVSHDVVVHGLRSQMQDTQENVRHSINEGYRGREEVEALREDIATLQAENRKLTNLLSQLGNVRGSDLGGVLSSGLGAQGTTRVAWSPSREAPSRPHTSFERRADDPQSIMKSTASPAVRPGNGPIFGAPSSVNQSGSEAPVNRSSTTVNTSTDDIHNVRVSPVRTRPTVEDGEGSSFVHGDPAAVDFAVQLKQWLLQELQEKRQPGGDRDGRTPPRRPSPVKPKTSDVQEMWARNSRHLSH